MKKIFTKISICSVFVSIVLSLMSVPAVLAQNGSGDTGKESITLSPAVSKPTVDAGEQIEGKLKVINDGTTGYTFLLYARPFSVDSESYDPNYTTVNERTEAYQWVQFEKSKLSLQPGEQVEVSYTITVPEKAKSGGHYAVLFAETQPQKDDDSQIARKKRVGSLLYITVNGDISLSGSVESWNTSLWQKNKPIEAELRLKNDGNVHYQADVTTTFSNIFGKELFTLKQQQLILPGTTRRIPIVWSDSRAVGIFKVSGFVNYLDKTEALPTKYIVLLPVPIAAIIGVLILLVLAKILLPKDFRKKLRKSKSRGKKK